MLRIKINLTLRNLECVKNQDDSPFSRELGGGSEGLLILSPLFVLDGKSLINVECESLCNNLFWVNGFEVII